MKAAVAALRAAHDAMAALPVDALTKVELVEILDDLETLTCQLPVQSHRLLARLQVETTAREMGAKSWRDVLALRWRISPSEAGRRLDEAALLASRQTLIGAPLEPVLPCTAIAQSHGVINPEHVRILSDKMSRIPPAIDATTRAQIEADLVKTAMGVGPKELKDHADRTLFLLDQDGPEPDETERARRRGVSKAPQQPDGMIGLKANLTPEAWAIYEAIFAKWEHRGCATRLTNSPARRELPPRTRSTATTAPWLSVSTMHWWRPVVACWRAAGSVSTTGCRPRSSSEPRCRTWRAARGSVSPVGAR